MMESDGLGESTGDLQGSIMGAFVASAQPAPVLTVDPPTTDPDPLGISGSGPAQSKPAPAVADKDGVGRRALEWILVLLGAFVLAVLIRQFMVQAFWIESESMQSTLEVRDRVLVNRLSYTFGDVSRGDVIVFARRPDEPGQTRDLIKRVIGLPGDTVEGRDNTIYINGSTDRTLR